MPPSDKPVRLYIAEKRGCRGAVRLVLLDQSVGPSCALCPDSGEDVKLFVNQHGIMTGLDPEFSPCRRPWVFAIIVDGVQWWTLWERDRITKKRSMKGRSHATS